MLADDRRPGLVRSFIAMPDGRRVEVELVELTPRSARCSVQREVLLTAAVGDPVTLWLVHARLRLDHPVPARLVHRSDHAERSTLGFEFTDPDALRAVLHPSLAHAFDHRASIRVPVEGPVTLVPPRDGRVALEVGRLHDLSVGGLAAEVSASFEEAMVGRALVQCLFRLPGDDAQLSVAGRIRHRTLLPDGRIRYGILFVESEDTRLDAVRDAIVAWLARTGAGLRSDG
jgi:hypothetical protein